MWKKCLTFSCLLTLLILLDPTLTPAQPGFGKGDRERKGDRPQGTGMFPGTPGATPSYPGAPGGTTPGGFNFGRPRPDGTSGFPTPGGTTPGGPTYTFGQPGGMNPGG